MWGSQSQDNNPQQQVKFVGNKQATAEMLRLSNTANQQQDANMVLNKPLPSQSGLSTENEEFLNLVMYKVEKGDINLYLPSTLMNPAVYQQLNNEQQGQMDIQAINMLSTIRRIKDLMAIGEKNTYQMDNLIEEFRLRKEDTEKNLGDVFII